MAERREFEVGPPDPVVERAQAFVRRYWSDGDSEDEVRADLQASTELSADELAADVAALRSLLDRPVNSWRLVYLVEIDANHGLDQAGEAAARAFLERFVALAEAALASSGPRPGRWPRPGALP